MIEPTPDEAMELSKRMIEDMPDSYEKQMMRLAHELATKVRNDAIRKLGEQK